MASVAHSTNVVMLPTSARRKVKNPAGLGFAAAVQDMSKHPAKWEDHGGCRPWEEAVFHRSPEMMVITALFKLLPDQAKEEVRRKIAAVADMNLSPHAATALHIVESVR